MPSFDFEQVTHSKQIFRNYFLGIRKLKKDQKNNIFHTVYEEKTKNDTEAYFNGNEFLCWIYWI
jgi:hypothetical protein